MPLVDRCPFQPLPLLGHRYTSVFWLEGAHDDVPLRVWDLSCASASLSGVQLPMVNRFTAYDLVVMSEDPLVLVADECTWVVPYFEPCALATKVIELCACSGAMSYGPEYLGAQVLASFEVNSFACDHLRRNQRGVVFQGDLTCDSDVRRFHETIVDESYGAMAGFPCQPFSVQGKQAGHDDPRAQVFWSVLRSMALLGAQYGILECVSPAATDQVIQAGLRLFGKIMKWQCKQAILDLAQQWVMARRRWWSAMMPNDWAHDSIPTWPTVSPQRCIHFVLPAWGEWSEHDERDLQLSLMEFLAYTNEEFGRETRLITPLDVGPTVLHSYGAALGACPCGCRDRGFSPMSLRSRGLRGVFIISEVTGQPRYLHPSELSLLLSIPLGMTWEICPRKSLCLLGQCAAPLQSLWMFAHVTKAAAGKFKQMHVIDPECAIDRYKQTLVKQAREVFPFASFQGPSHLRIQMSDGGCLNVLREGLTTVGHLLGAERIHLGWGFKAHCMLNGEILDEKETLQPQGEYQIVHKAKKQRKNIATEMLTIAIRHLEEGYTTLVEPGAFLFQALSEFGLDEVQFLVDEDGKVYGRDFKVWHSLFLHALNPEDFPTLCPKWKCRPLGVDAAFGPGQHGGLSVNTVWHAVKSLVKSARCSTTHRSLLIHPSYAHDLRDGNLSVCDAVRMHCEGHAVEEVIIPMLFHAHWALLVGVLVDQVWEWRYLDGWSYEMSQHASCLASTMTELLGGRDWCLEHGCEVRQEHSCTCGSVLVAHLMKVLELQGHFTSEHITAMHAWFLTHQGDDESEVGWGPDQKLVENLARILLEK